MRRTVKRPKMAVVRAFPRIPECSFYTFFTKMKVKLIGNNQKIANLFKDSGRNIESVYLRLKPAYFLDPIKLIYRHETHRSWSFFDELEDSVRDCNVINISDTFYFYCGQCAEISEKLKKPLVTIVWETLPGHPATYLPPYCLNVKKVINNTRLFILRSKRALNFTDSLNIPHSKVEVIYKGIDLAKFYPPKTLKLGKPLTILYVGQLVKPKGVGDLLKAFIKLYQRYKNVELVLAGTGYLKEQIVTLSKIYPIRYLGYIDYFRLPEIYRNAHIFCSPSREERYFGTLVGEERFSYTLMEAQASGLPIVATKCGGILEEIGKENLLVEQGDVVGLTLALEKLIKDKSLLERLGKLNRKRAEELFDVRKQAKKTEEAIYSII